MRAPRAWACSSDSTTATAAPSESTNPSRSRSKGRLARSGSSLRSETARELAKPAISRRVDQRVGAAGEDHVARALAHVAAGFADAVQARGAGVADGEVRSAHLETDRHLGGRHVGGDGGDVERRDPPRSFGVETADGTKDGARAAVVVAEEHADATGVLRRDRERGVLDRHHRRGDGVAREVVHALQVLGRHVATCLEVADLTSDAAFLVGDVEEGDRTDSGAALAGALPDRVDAGTDRRHSPHPRDHDASRHRPGSLARIRGQVHALGYAERVSARYLQRSLLPPALGVQARVALAQLAPARNVTLRVAALASAGARIAPPALN